MASLALIPVGQSLLASYATGGILGLEALTGAAIGGMAFGAAGAVIDSMFLMPEIFGTPHQSTSGPRIEEPGIMLASEGTDIPWYVGGDKIKGTGFLFYAGKFEEEVIVQSSSGSKGGGSSASSTTYTYFCDLAVGIGEGARIL